MERYEKYKDSGIEWVGEIPEHWRIIKLKYLANANPSNIDKKSNNDEDEIFLCNYVDVYNNEFITSDLNFMKATANKNQIAKFILEKGDVIATKDSETPDDIANPALVVEDFENVVCGYHLTHIKPKDIYGEYLFRQFQSTFLQAYFEVSANGVTRYGLGVDKFNSVLILVPNHDEQTAITNYLDRKTAEIDDLIAQKEQLLALYEEEKTAIINQAVTKGINPDVKMKDSSIDWLGEIPAHWEMKKLKYVAVINSEALSDKTDDNFKIKYIDIGNVEYGKLKEKPKVLSFRNAPSRARRIVKSGDTLISTVRTYLKAILFIENADNNLIASTGFAVISPKTIIHSNYLFFILSNEIILQNISASSVGVSYPAINSIEIGNLFVWYPDKDEQIAIAAHIEKETARIGAKIEKTERLIELQKEYRTALISEVVTGKIKVMDENES